MTLDIRLRPGINGVYHTFSRTGTTAGIDCSLGNCLERTALTTSFMRWVVKVDIREACDELREGGETSRRTGAEDAGERNNNRGLQGTRCWQRGTNAGGHFAM